MNETQTGTTTPSQSWLGSNGNEGVLHIPQITKLEPHHYMHFNIVSRTHVGDKSK